MTTNPNADHLGRLPFGKENLPKDFYNGSSFGLIAVLSIKPKNYIPFPIPFPIPF